MLSNEKYKGDALLQKTYTVDFLIKKKVVNTGQIPRYYVEESHPAIIDKDMWEAVQLEMERRRAFAEKHGIIKVDYDRQIINHLLLKRILSVGGFFMLEDPWTWRLPKVFGEIKRLVKFEFIK